MKKFILITLGIFIFCFCLAFQALAQEAKPLVVFLFTSEKCPFCDQAENYFEVVKKQQYPAMELITMSLQQAGVYDILQKFTQIYKIEAGSVPVAFIGDKAIVGYYPDQYRAMLDNCQRTNCEPPFEALKEQMAKKTVAAAPNEPTFNLFSNKWALAITIIGFGVLLAVLSLFATRK